MVKYHYGYVHKSAEIIVYKKHLLIIIFSGIVVSLFTLLFNQILVYILPNCGPQLLGKIGCYDISVLALFTSLLISNIFGGLLLYRYKIAHPMQLAIFALGETFLLQPLTIIYIPFILKLLIFFFIFILSYVLADSIFNTWRVQIHYKLTSVAIILVLTELALQASGLGYIPR
jgi:hypothetical protein